jgi:RNA polymerase sigma-70 factor (ECF subfamily)
MNTSPDLPSNSMPESSADEARKASDLARKAQTGDENAFGELVKMYHARLYGVVFNVVRNPEDARELTQLTWVKAWNKIGTFKADAGFFTWLYRIATNTSLDFLRSKGRRHEESLSARREEAPEADIDLPAGDNWRPDRTVEQSEIQKSFEAALDKLSPEHRMALTLREVEGLSYQEIAAAMKCRVGTVMSRIFYARKLIQQEMRGLL